MTRTKREVIVRDVGGRIGGEQGASKRGRWLEAVWAYSGLSVSLLSVSREGRSPPAPPPNPKPYVLSTLY